MNTKTQLEQAQQDLSYAKEIMDAAADAMITACGSRNHTGNRDQLSADLDAARAAYIEAQRGVFLAMMK